MTRLLIAIFLGGGTGSVLRYCVQMMLHERIVPYSFPWATFTVNILGSFLIGLFYTLSARFNLSTEVRLLLTTGLCGGFTTFSTFSNDGLILIKQEFYGMFALYTLLSITLGVLAAFAGGAFGRCISLNPQLHSRSATYIKRNGLLIRKITIKSSRPFQCAYHPLTP